MADVYEKDLAQKSSLTASDYIRVVGSDNVSYKQPTSSILSAWGIDKLTGELASSFSGDANTLTSTGQWQVGNTANVQNLPSGANYGILAVESARSYIYQRYINLTDVIVYYRRSVDRGANWSAWAKEPTRAEVDALDSNQTKVRDVGVAGKTFTIPNNYRGTLFIHDSTPARNGIYMIYCASTGGVGYKAISSATEVTLDVSTVNKLKITTSVGSRAVMFLNAQYVVTV